MYPFSLFIWYEPKDIMKIVREWTNKTQKEFREDVKKSNEDEKWLLEITSSRFYLIFNWFFKSIPNFISWII